MSVAVFQPDYTCLTPYDLSYHLNWQSLGGEPPTLQGPGTGYPPHEFDWAYIDRADWIPIYGEVAVNNVSVGATNWTELGDGCAIYASGEARLESGACIHNTFIEAGFRGAGISVNTSALSDSTLQVPEWYPGAPSAYAINFNTVTASVWCNGYTNLWDAYVWAATIHGTAFFNGPNTSMGNSYVWGDAYFSNGSGVIPNGYREDVTGDAYVYYPFPKPFPGLVGGDIFYLNYPPDGTPDILFTGIESAACFGAALL